MRNIFQISQNSGTTLKDIQNCCQITQNEWIIIIINLNTESGMVMAINVLENNLYLKPRNMEPHKSRNKRFS